MKTNFKEGSLHTRFVRDIHTMLNFWRTQFRLYLGHQYKLEVATMIQINQEIARTGLGIAKSLRSCEVFGDYSVNAM